MRMNQLPKVVIGTNPADKNGAGASLTAACDSLGFGSMMVLINVGNIAGDLTAGFALTECDTSGGTYTAVSGASFAETAYPLNASHDNTVVAMYITLGAGRKRFFKVGYTPAASATLVCINFLLFEPDAAPVTATRHGVSFQVVV